MISRVLHTHIPLETFALTHALLGMQLLRRDGNTLCGGRIVEVEAYPLQDPASHAFRGRTPRCTSMFLRHWHAYVYRIYGRLFCLNISSEDEGCGAAVLIRAIVPEQGIARMQERRSTTNLRDLTRGPGRLTQALGIGIELDGCDLDTSNELSLHPAEHPTHVAYGPRIGLNRAIEAPWRFFDPASPFVSGSKRLNQTASQIAYDQLLSVQLRTPKEHYV